GQGNLSGEIIKSIKLFFPQPPEQQKIADFLLVFDDQIDIQTGKIDILRKHKKGLVQQLIPVVNEVTA
ncbi:restriction endonuclease subunit S, partial [Enterobacter asburiae]